MGYLDRPSAQRTLQAQSKGWLRFVTNRSAYLQACVVGISGTIGTVILVAVFVIKDSDKGLDHYATLVAAAVLMLFGVTTAAVMGVGRALLKRVERAEGELRALRNARESESAQSKGPVQDS